MTASVHPGRVGVQGVRTWCSAIEALLGFLDLVLRHRGPAWFSGLGAPRWRPCLLFWTWCSTIEAGGRSGVSVPLTAFGPQPQVIFSRCQLRSLTFSSLGLG